MAVFGRLRMPSLGGTTGWLNSEPIGPAELQGRVVLFNFWTLTCINWLRQEPYVRAWSQAYRDEGSLRCDGASARRLARSRPDGGPSRYRRRRLDDRTLH
jgi:hypothetical protein